MATATEVIKNKRRYEGNEHGEEVQKIKKKRKITKDDGFQKEENATILSKEKKPRLPVAPFGTDCEISYDQLFEFLKCSALGERCGATLPSWCRIHHRRHLAGIAVVVLREVGQLHFNQFYLQFSHLRKTFRHHFLLPALSNDSMGKLSGPRQDDCQISRQEVEKNPIIEKYGEEPQGLSHYLLTQEEMRSYDYPLEGSENCRRFVHTCCNGLVTDSSPLFGLDCEMVLKRALEEIPRSSFSVIQFALDSRHMTSALIAEASSKMKSKLDNMLTVYAGPFGKDVCLKSVKRAFKRYGHIRSIRIIPETFKPYICIQYEVLEAAQLAVDRLHGTKIRGSRIKVQRPITETTLDCERLVKELEKDAANEAVVYLAGTRRTQSEADLQEELSDLKGLRSVLLPRDPETGRQRRYCFLKFQTPESAANALAALEELAARGSKLQSRQAISLPWLHPWASPAKQNGGLLAASPPHRTSHLQEDVLKKAMKAFDGKIRKLYQCLPNNTLCVILLPGTDRLPGPLPGFGVLGIKDENASVGSR
ncbi:hypothetical protein JRQ81_010206 [Phrynocephalus forsythii]|uniref:RRM domain-containing protein n=1 Tax=Phrynocephalus forsythii TaxID=171643 RepID=A0A9Q0XA08_9SAUR|nr:hypothetical protein JRQ81_010206 [Phrynocephalus forsythii]